MEINPREGYYRYLNELYRHSFQEIDPAKRGIKPKHGIDYAEKLCNRANVQLKREE